MKKILSLVMSAVMALGFSVTAMAATEVTSEAKQADVTLEITRLVEVITEGETVDLTATTLKKGSEYNVEWSVCGVDVSGQSLSVPAENYALEEGITELQLLPVEESSEELDNFYVSNAKFTGNKAGTYVIIASVTMTAGKSHVSWTGSDSQTQEVKAAKVVSDLVAKTTKSEAEKNKQGNITGYNVTYDVYIQYEDGTEEVLTSGATYSLAASGKSKNVDIEYEGVTYTVTVSP